MAAEPTTVAEVDERLSSVAARLFERIYELEQQLKEKKRQRTEDVTLIGDLAVKIVEYDRRLRVLENKCKIPSVRVEKQKSPPLAPKRSASHGQGRECDHEWHPYTWSTELGRYLSEEEGGEVFCFSCRTIGAPRPI